MSDWNLIKENVQNVLDFFKRLSVYQETQHAVLRALLSFPQISIVLRVGISGHYQLCAYLYTSIGYEQYRLITSYAIFDC